MARFRSTHHFQRVVVCALALAVAVAGQDAANERSLSTSVAGMEMLLEVEGQLLSHMEDYANALSKKLTTVRGAIAAMRAENAKSQVNPELYLSNPVNAYSLIRRMHSDWVHWELFLRRPVGEDAVEKINQLHVVLPTSNDLAEASDAIHRLQITYDLQPADMAKGLLNGKNYSVSFSSLDCYSIGFELLKRDQFYNAGFWLYTALSLYEPSDVYEVMAYDKLKILEAYAQNFLKQNRYDDAINTIRVAVAESPNSAKYLKAMQDIEEQKTINLGRPVPDPTRAPDVYQRGCRGEFSAQPSRLHCVYNTTTSAFLRLAPLKMEILQLDPYMVLYHDVMSDAEIEELKRMAMPNLKRATVFNEGQKKSVVVSRRTSKFSWFGDDASPTTTRLNRRIVDMTGFDLWGAEKLQVMNYGLGGHYDTHYDFFNVSDTTEVVSAHGDRISTVLFYMTDVEQGGATVFPNIRAAVYPRKGTAVMWYNLNNRGEGDWRTLHAACPVIVGSKWVTNKWIREKSQMFRRPCYRS